MGGTEAGSSLLGINCLCPQSRSFNNPLTSNLCYCLGKLLTTALVVVFALLCFAISHMHYTHILYSVIWLKTTTQSFQLKNFFIRWSYCKHILIKCTKYKLINCQTSWITTDKIGMCLYGHYIMSNAECSHLDGCLLQTHSLH